VYRLTGRHRANNCWRSSPDSIAWIRVDWVGSVSSNATSAYSTVFDMFRTWDATRKKVCRCCEEDWGEPMKDASLPTNGRLGSTGSLKWSCRNYIGPRRWKRIAMLIIILLITLNVVIWRHESVDNGALTRYRFTLNPLRTTKTSWNNKNEWKLFYWQKL